MKSIMEFSWEDLFKYVKLVVVHPAVEIVIEIIYLVTSLTIGYLIFKESTEYDQHQILEITQSYLNFNNFNNIRTSTEFKSYLISLLDKLYTLDPSTQEIPLFIPTNPIRINYFTLANKCKDINDFADTCANDMHKFKCAIDNLVTFFKYECGETYSDGYEFLTKKLKGYYTSYNLRKNKKYIDITRHSYYSSLQDQVNEIIDNKKLKAIILQINLKAPSNNDYIDAILGIEMTNYFTNVKNIFSIYIINVDRPSTNVFLYVSLIFLIISVFMSTLKLIYEMNVKCIYKIHILLFLVKTFEIIFIIACIAYMVEDKKLEFEINLNEFESHIKYINIIWLLKIFYGIMVLFLPFRFLSLISWFKVISELMVALLNILFRMLPGIIISYFYTIILFFIFSVINYFLFNDIFPYYETMYQSFISTFNINILSSVYNLKSPSRIFNNLFLSSYSIFFLFFEFISFFFFISIFIATAVYVFKQAILFQEKEEKNEYLEKLNEIQNKLEEKNNLNEINNIEINEMNKKQILWFSLDKDKDKVRNSVENENYDMLYFKNSNQILSFLKYIFTMKPHLQHVKLNYKLIIVLETNQKHFESNERDEINKLTDWLIFIECKIPLIFYGKTHLDNSYKIKLKSLYKFSYFINNKKELDKFLESDGKKVMVVSSNEQFTLGKKN